MKYFVLFFIIFLNSSSLAFASGEKRFLSLSSVEGQALIEKLYTNVYPEELPPCRLKNNYSITTEDNSSPFVNLTEKADGVYVLSFDLNNDSERNLFLPERYAGEGNISTVSLNKLLTSRSKETKLIRAIHQLTLYSGKLTGKYVNAQAQDSATAKKRSSSPRNQLEKLSQAQLNQQKRKEMEESIKKYSLPMPYIISRLYYDNPGKGFLVLQREENGFLYLRGIGWYCPFTTWSAGFLWNQDRNPAHIQKFLEDLKTETQEDASLVFPELAELSILCAAGCGGDILKMIQKSVLNDKNEKKQFLYKALITDAKETVIPFYQSFGFKPIEATAEYRKSPAVDAPMTRTTYSHWCDSDTAMIKDDPAHLYILPINREERRRVLTLTFKSSRKRSSSS